MNGSKLEVSPNQIIYAFAHCEAWLEDFAKTNRLPTHELTEWVATLLLSQTSGQVMGLEHPMSSVSGSRRETSERGKALAEVAMASGAHGKASLKKRKLSAAARKRIGAAQRKRWRKVRQDAKKGKILKLAA
jgi:hypothetical protein